MESFFRRLSQARSVKKEKEKEILGPQLLSLIEEGRYEGMRENEERRPANSEPWRGIKETLSTGQAWGGGALYPIISLETKFLISVQLKAWESWSGTQRRLIQNAVFRAPPLHKLYLVHRINYPQASLLFLRLILAHLLFPPSAYHALSYFLFLTVGVLFRRDINEALIYYKIHLS